MYGKHTFSFSATQRVIFSLYFSQNSQRVFFNIYIYNVYYKHFNKFLSPHYKLDKVLEHLNSVICLAKYEKVKFYFLWLWTWELESGFCFLFFVFPFDSLKLEFYHPFNFILIIHFIFTTYHRLNDSKYIVCRLRTSAISIFF